MVSPLLCLDEGLVRRAQTVVDMLQQHRQTVVTAESCTAGLVAAALSYAPGAGECLEGGFIVYSKQQKVAALDISLSLLQQKGSVNAEVAEQLAKGALDRSSANIALAVTGVVGPNPDEDGAQPGHAFFAIARRARTVSVKEMHLRLETPDEVRRALVERALELLHTAAARG